MRSSKRQKGAAMWQTCIHICFFLFVVTFALKLGPLYIDDSNISTILNNVHEDLSGKDIYEVTNSDIKNRVGKYFQVSMIADQRLEDIKVERTAGKVMLMMNYDARNSLVGNIDAVVHFKHEINLAEPFKK
jgi:hypothetical protein